jgi:hypothetical protein
VPSLSGAHLAVVDPFLMAPVMAGEWFYALIIPGATEALRHDWAHPVIDSINFARALTGAKTPEEIEEAEHDAFCQGSC